VVIEEATTTKVRGMKRLPRTARGVVLAEGEATGHAHVIDSEHARLYVDPANDNVRILVLLRPCDLLHEEHQTIRLPKGRYRVGTKRQYSPDGWTRVLD
jgi:hypothetical protein